MHFNANGLTSDGNLAIDQINIRHAERIQAEENPPLPGRYRAGRADINGDQCFVCQDRRTGLNPSTTAAPTSLQEELVLEVVQTIRRWGTNGNLFNVNNPDPTTLQRVETGARSGQLVRDRSGNPVPMFQGARFANGYGGIAFAPDGSLYDPFTMHGGDIVNTPNFYQA
jgi:hypothetical protein